MKKAVWLSFDLGVNGDYESLYAWLADHDAEECGDSVAFFSYDAQTDLVSEIKAELQKTIDIRRSTRIYLIYKNNEDGKIKGTFLFGKRKQAPWTGYGSSEANVTDES